MIGHEEDLCSQTLWTAQTGGRKQLAGHLHPFEIRDS